MAAGRRPRRTRKQIIRDRQLVEVRSGLYALDRLIRYYEENGEDDFSTLGEALAETMLHLSIRGELKTFHKDGNVITPQVNREAFIQMIEQWQEALAEAKDALDSVAPRFERPFEDDEEE